MVPLLVITISVMIIAGVLWSVGVVRVLTQKYQSHAHTNVTRLFSTTPTVGATFTIVTLETRDLPMVELHNESMQAYCQYHGYTYIFLDHFESSFAVYWQKLQVVLQTMEATTSDFVMWVDSDVIVQYPSLSLSIITNTQESVIYWARDLEGDKPLNAGVFIVRNNQSGRYFLEECFRVYLARKRECYKYNTKGLNSTWSGRCYEQGVMNEVAATHPELVCVVHDTLISNNDKTKPDSMILHMFGNKERATNEFRRIKAWRGGSLGIYKHTARARIAVLLVMRGTPKTVAAYKKRITWWLGTGLPVYVADSGGQLQTGFRVLSLAHSAKTKDLDHAAVEAAVASFSDEWVSYDFVAVVDCRYVLETFLGLIPCVCPEVELVVQSGACDTEFRTDFFAIKPHLLTTLLSLSDQSIGRGVRGLMEQCTWQRLDPLLISPGWAMARDDTIKMLYL